MTVLANLKRITEHMRTHRHSIIHGRLGMETVYDERKLTVLIYEYMSKCKYPRYLKKYKLRYIGNETIMKLVSRKHDYSNI